MTKEQTYKKIVGSEELSDRFNSIKDKSTLQSFLLEIGYDADAEDFISYVKSMYEGEVDDQTAQDIAGGKQKYPSL
ncbi:MAG: hypothetical protein IK057_04720 [Clostridia bacterium]|nr:hypothetical protein [Clostridia bacterium]